MYCVNSIVDCINTLKVVIYYIAVLINWLHIINTWQTSNRRTVQLIGQWYGTSSKHYIFKACNVLNESWISNISENLLTNTTDMTYCAVARNTQV